MEDNNENINDDGMNDYDRDKIQKQSLVLSTIKSACTVTSPYKDIQLIATALKSDKYKLAIENLSGGYTNYTYKVFLVPIDGDNDGGGGDTKESTALFVKLCFPRAFWNPDPTYVYDVQRIANEYEMMVKFAKLAPGCVATPNLLLDIDDMKLLATQWSPSDEQMANQFIDGVADNRVAKGLAKAIAALHCSDIDPNFNTDARDCMIDLFPSMEEELVKMAKDEAGVSNRASKLAVEIGVEGCKHIFDNVTMSYRDQVIPCHTDLHMFNILAEKKPQIDLFSEKDDIFGEEGSFAICDWEMCMSGPLGLDMGRLYSIPVACILAHTISGNITSVADGIIEWLDLYWKEYCAAMTKQGGKDEDFLPKSYRNAMAWLGWKLYAISIFEWFIPFLPECDTVVFKESLGVVGITLLKWGFGGYEVGLGVDELHSRLNATISDEVRFIKSTRRGSAHRRRSSVLRETNRRVSDAFQGMGRTSMKKMIAEVSLED